MRLSRGLQVIHPLVLGSFLILILSAKETEGQDYLGDNGNGNSPELVRQKPLRLEDILPHQEKIYYDKMVPPKENGNPTVVFFHVTVMSLDSIDESSMTFVADIFFAQSWKDNRLKMPQNMTSYRLVPVQFLQDLWRPDSFFKNAKKVTFQDMTIPNHYIWLHDDRTILYMVNPHDSQICSIKIESLSNTVNDLIFVWDPKLPLDVDTRIELPQLDLVSSTTGDCTQEYLTGNFTCVEVIFKFRRRLGYYLFHTYVPTCLIVIMSWISFWIKPEAIDIFMSMCTIFVFFSLMEYAVVNILMGDFVDSRESLIQRSLRSMRGRITTFHQQGRRRTPVYSDNEPAEQIPMNMNGESLATPPSENEGSHGHSSSSHHQHHNIPHQRILQGQETRRERAIFIDRLSRVLFPLSFTIFNVAYWSISLLILNAESSPF